MIIWSQLYFTVLIYLIELHSVIGDEDYFVYIRPIKPDYPRALSL